MGLYEGHIAARIFGLAAVLLAPVAASAQGAPMSEAQACRVIAEPTARLACFDRAVASVPAPAAATATAAAAPAPPQAVLSQRPTDPGLGTALVRSAAKGGDGRLTLALDNGAVWRQVDDKTIVRMPQAGGRAEVGKGAFGYYVKLESGSRFWVRRVQ